MVDYNIKLLGIIVDRKLQMKLPVRLTIQGEAPVGQRLIQTGFDAFRAFPISSVNNTMAVSLNNTSVSINMSDVIHALTRYNTGEKIRDREYSTTPCMLDQYQNYADGATSNRNPLGTYGDMYPEMGRGGFPYTAITNPVGLGIGGGAVTAIIEADLTEYLYLSPFVFGHGDKAGFIGIQNMDFNFTFASDLTRMWCHDNSSGSILSSINVEFFQPSLLFKYITPGVIQPIPMSAVYPLTF